MDKLIELDRRITRAVQSGRGIRLSDEELDLLVSIGAIESLKDAATKALAAQATSRQQEREEIRKLERKERRQEASELAFQRAREMTHRGGRVTRSQLSKQP